MIADITPICAPFDHVRDVRFGHTGRVVGMHINSDYDVAYDVELDRWDEEQQTTVQSGGRDNKSHSLPAKYLEVLTAAGVTTFDTNIPEIMLAGATEMVTGTHGTIIGVSIHPQGCASVDFICDVRDEKKNSLQAFGINLSRMEFDTEGDK